MPSEFSTVALARCGCSSGPIWNVVFQTREGANDHRAKATIEITGYSIDSRRERIERVCCKAHDRKAKTVGGVLIQFLYCCGRLSINDESLCGIHRRQRSVCDEELEPEHHRIPPITSRRSISFPKKFLLTFASSCSRMFAKFSLVNENNFKLEVERN